MTERVRRALAVLAGMVAVIVVAANAGGPWELTANAAAVLLIVAAVAL